MGTGAPTDQSSSYAPSDVGLSDSVSALIGVRQVGFLHQCEDARKDQTLLSVDLRVQRISAQAWARRARLWPAFWLILLDELVLLRCPSAVTSLRE
jgi:hypothetical protein